GLDSETAFERAGGGHLDIAKDGARRHAEWDEIEALDYDLNFVVVGGRVAIDQPQVQMNIFVSTLRHFGGVGENIGGDEVGRGGGIRAGLALETDPVGFPDEEVRGVGESRRHAVTHEMAG